MPIVGEQYYGEMRQLGQQQFQFAMALKKLMEERERFRQQQELAKKHLKAQVDYWNNQIELEKQRTAYEQQKLNLYQMEHEKRMKVLEIQYNKFKAEVDQLKDEGEIKKRTREFMNQVFNFLQQSPEAMEKLQKAAPAIGAAMLGAPPAVSTSLLPTDLLPAATGEQPKPMTKSELDALDTATTGLVKGTFNMKLPDGTTVSTPEDAAKAYDRLNRMTMTKVNALNAELQKYGLDLLQARTLEEAANDAKKLVANLDSKGVQEKIKQTAGNYQEAVERLKSMAASIQEDFNKYTRAQSILTRINSGIRKVMEDAYYEAKTKGIPQPLVYARQKVNQKYGKALKRLSFLASDPDVQPILDAFYSTADKKAKRPGKEKPIIDELMGLLRAKFPNDSNEDIRTLIVLLYQTHGGFSS